LNAAQQAFVVDRCGAERLSPQPLGCTYRSIEGGARMGDPAG